MTPHALKHCRAFARSRQVWATALACLSIQATLDTALADDGFNPFQQSPPSAQSKKSAITKSIAPTPQNSGPGSEDNAPLPSTPDQRLGGVERGDLTPIIAPDGNGLPFELWRGLDVNALEGQLAKLEIPPRSPAVHDLWRRLITSNVTPPDGASNNGRFDVIRAEILYRSGLLLEAETAIDAAGGAAGAADPVRVQLAARIEIGLGHMEKGCELIKPIAAHKADLPKPLRSDVLLMSGVCAAAGGNTAGAGLIADLAREEKSDDAASLAILDAIASGQKAPVHGLKTVTLLVYRALALAGGVELKDAVEHGDPALLAALALDTATPPAERLAAAEAAARVNAITPDGLASLYRDLGAPTAAETLLTGPSGANAPGATQRRAALFKAAEAERTPLKKVRLMRALLDEARRSGLYLQALAMLAKPTDQIQPVPEIGWFAESAVEIGLASGNIARARQWTTLGGAVPGDNGLKHWQALLDLADPALQGDRGRNLGAVEDMAQRGRLPPDLLNRLATVLDANDINVPIPLWEAASKVPPSTGGYLPETGVLTDLQDAAKKHEFGRTVLLVMRALGKSGAEGANQIALGDSIRALRKSGLDNDARRLSIEALFAQWPRNVVN